PGRCQRPGRAHADLHRRRPDLLDGRRLLPAPHLAGGDPMRQWIIRLLALATIVWSMACGGDFGAGGDSCSFSLVITPELPVRGDIVEAAVNVSIDGEVSGIEVVDWSIQYDGADVAFDVTGANGDEVVFTAGPVGVYNIAVSGSV